MKNVSSKDDDAYEPKWVPVPKSGIWPMLETEYRIARQLRKVLGLDKDEPVK